jgi:peptidoglycan/xylan/chitin deacetylase (PgdA/CDA1 family)/SAM-dependent methyltransferase
MTSLSIVVSCGTSLRTISRPLVLSADALLRQTVPPGDVTLAMPDGPPPPLARSTAERLRARIVSGGSAEAGINAAVAAAAGEYVAILPAGFLPAPDFIDGVIDAAAAAPTVSAFAPPVRLRTPDDTDAVVWRPNGTSLGAILADPFASPAVVVVRADVWRRLGGLDAALGPLSACDVWLRLAVDPGGVLVLPRALVARELAPKGTTALPEAEGARAMEALVEKHRAAIEASMADVLVAQELRFVRIREAHAALVRRRDEELAELDRVRADAAHHRAFLAHHQVDGFEWGDLRRPDPVSRDWGYDRGGPVDRRHIEAFLAAHSSDIQGRVLEVQEGDFTTRFGAGRVTELAILDVDATNQNATVLADLRSASEIPADQFDCIVLTQTLHVIDDIRAALSECRRILRPGGVLLATFPAASRVCLEYGPDGDLWRMTPAGARDIVARTFGAANVADDVRGNVLTNVAFLEGLGAGELTGEEYARVDPYFPAVTGIRARKETGTRRRTGGRGAVLLYHRVADVDDAHGLAVPPHLFAEHLEWIGRHCTVVPLDVLLSAPHGTLPERALALTFDDGYVDNLHAAAHIVEAGMAATFFLTTAHIATRGEYWWDTLERVLLRTPALPTRLELTVDGVSRGFPTELPEQRAAAHWQLHPLMVRARLEDRDRMVARVREWAGDSQVGPGPLLADEIRALSRLPGMTVGAHGVHHLALPAQALDVQAREVEASCETLRRLTGQPVNLFAYPYGDTSWDAADVVRSRGLWGVTCVEARVEDSFDAAQAPRLDVKRWRVEDLAARVERLLAGASAGPDAISLSP